MNIAYATALIISAIVAAAVSVICWSKRHSVGATSLAVATTAMSVWAFSYALMWLSTTTAHIHFWLNMTYLGVVVIPPALLFFALEHTGRTRYVRTRSIVLLLIVPMLTLAILWTDPAHGLFYGGEQVGTAILSGGPWFWVNAVYSYVLLGTVAALLTVDFLKAPPLYRRQSGSILVAITLPFMVNILSVLRLDPLPQLDFTPMVFTVTAAIIAFALFRFSMLEIVPFARGKLVDSMADGVIVLDDKERIVDLNSAATQFTSVAISSIGDYARNALPNWSVKPELVEDDVWSREVVVEPIAATTVEVRWNRLFDSGRTAGHLITLRDITARAVAESALTQYREELERLAVTDELTGLANRRKAIETLTSEFSRFARTGSPLSAVMLDLDNFKSINDSFGHAVGDDVLAEVSHRITEAVRDYDLAARIGGEEFLIVAPGTDREGAFVLGERLRNAIRQELIMSGDQSLKVTISVGVSTARDSDADIDPLLARADQALYDAKHRGKDRVVVN